jgi:FKBP-type peptidyl-prolyl cis-trans isomerase FklB
MKAVWFACVCLVLIACQGNTQEKVQLKTHVDSVSYGIGMDIGKNLKMQEIDFTAAALAQGVKDASDPSHAMLDSATIALVMAQFRNELVMKQQQKTSSMSAKTRKEGEDFLAANKSKAGVKTTASGLQYKVIKEGTGAKPKESDTVVINYRGTLIDGTEFDSSYKRGEPTTWAVNRFIRGWTEALQLMKIGSKYELYIPTDLAYADRPPTPTIPPGAALVFEIELLGIK